MRAVVQVAVIAGALVLGACGGDAKINDAVTQALRDEHTPSLQYEITTKDRIVMLSGVVATEADRDRIERTARDVPGVLGVDNRLKVQESVQTTGANDVAFNPEDRALKNAVRGKLDSIGVSVSGVEVEVRDGIVTLHGEIPMDRHDAVLASARQADPKIQRVDDRLVLLR